MEIYVLPFCILVLFLNFSNSIDKCCNKQCHNNLIFKEYCDECDLSKVEYVLRNESIILTCITCDNEPEINLKWSYDKRKINVSISKFDTNQNVSAIRATLNTKTFEDSGPLVCTTTSENHFGFFQRQFVVCSAIYKPDFACIVYPNELNAFEMDCNLTTNVEHYINQNSCNYTILFNESVPPLTKNQIFRVIDFPIKLKILHNNFLVNNSFNLAINAISKVENKLFHLAVPSVEQIYFQDIAPSMQNSSNSSCTLSLDIPLFSKTSKNINLLFNITLTNAKGVIVQQLNFDGILISNPYIKRIEGLKPYHTYKLETIYKLKDSQYSSNKHISECETKRTAPNTNLNVSPGCYFNSNGNDWIVLWKSIPTEDHAAPDFQYVIVKSDHPREYRTYDAFFEFSIENEENKNFNLSVSLRNEIGRSDASTNIEIIPSLRAISPVVVVTQDALNFFWNSMPNVRSCVLFWCFNESWTKCNGSLDWIEISSGQTKFKLRTNNSLPNVYALSTCYDAKCSQMKSAIDPETYLASIFQEDYRFNQMENGFMTMEWNASNFINNSNEAFEVNWKLLFLETNHTELVNANLENFTFSCNGFETLNISLTPNLKIYLEDDFVSVYGGPVYFNVTCGAQLQSSLNFMKSQTSILFVIGIVVAAMIFLIIAVLIGFAFKKLRKSDARILADLNNTIKYEEEFNYEDYLQARQKRNEETRESLEKTYGQPLIDLSEGQVVMTTFDQNKNDEFEKALNTSLENNATDKETKSPNDTLHWQSNSELDAVLEKDKSFKSDNSSDKCSTFKQGHRSSLAPSIYETLIKHKLGDKETL